MVSFIIPQKNVSYLTFRNVFRIVVKLNLASCTQHLVLMSEYSLWLAGAVFRNTGAFVLFCLLIMFIFSSGYQKESNGCSEWERNIYATVKCALSWFCVHFKNLVAFLKQRFVFI